MVGYLAVYRVSFTVVVFHFVLGMLTLCVRNSSDCRAGIHNGLVCGHPYTYFIEKVQEVEKEMRNDINYLL